MSDQQSSIQFRTKSISELVHELNTLGQNTVVIQPMMLIGVVDRQSENVRRFRSRSVQKLGKSRDSGDGRDGGDGGKSCDRELLEFFLSQGSNKKYYYNQIVNELQVPTLGKMLSMFQQGFNTTIVMEFSRYRFEEILTKIEPWLEASEEDKCFYGSFLEYGTKEIVDLISGKGRSWGMGESGEKETEYYQTSVKQLLNIKTQPQQSIKLLKLLKKPSPLITPQSTPQLTLLLLPPQLLSPTSPSTQISPTLKTLKSQLTQLLNYIKTNPNKKYENFSKILPKKFPLTGVLVQGLLGDCVGVCVNWVNDGDEGREGREGKGNVGRLEFFGKLSIVSNLVKKATNNKKRIIIRNKKSISASSISKSKSKPKPKQSLPVIPQSLSQSHLDHHPSQHKPSPTQTNLNLNPSTSQLQFCRSLQRKTHKYSITEFSQLSNPDQDPLFPQTIPLYPTLPPQLTQPQSLTILKAQHARQISQYHETIQNLNRKLLVVMEEKGFGELYAIHQKEIMMLELKIRELRGTIGKLCEGREGKEGRDGKGNSKEVQGLKEVIKKLNQELLNDKKNGMVTKLNQGKIKMMEKELAEWKEKYTKSEIARKQLKLELEASINRLNLKSQSQIPQPTLPTTLSPKQLSTLSQLSTFLSLPNPHSSPSSPSSPSIPKQSIPYILQKFKQTLTTISKLRETVGECQDFLVDLQAHVEEKLGDRDPEIVLDCNRFVRGFLLSNLEVF